MLTKENYTLVSVSYIAIVDSFGTVCENCGRLISNIATVKNDLNKHFTIGLDCAKTLLSKEVFTEAGKEIARKKKISEKIKELERNNKPYVLNESRQPCYPPEMRSGYLIAY